MQWKASLLVCVAIASGLMSLIHLYLLSTSSYNSISVAVEIPLGQAQHPQSTNLELNIKSVSDREKLSVGIKDQNMDRQVKSSTLFKDIGATGHSKSDTQSLLNAKKVVQYSTQAQHIPLISKEETSKEEEGVSREDSEDYTVLLDTGDYELVEKDIDQVIEDTTTTVPHKIYSSKRPRYANVVKDHLQPQPPTKVETHLTGRYISSEPVDNSVPAKEHTSNDRVQEEHVEMVYDTPNGSVGQEQLEDKGKVKPKVIVLTKEEYNARQATRARPIHPTQSPHKTPPPHHISTVCTVLPCLQYLSLTERNIYKKCQKRTTPHKTSHSPPPCHCKFREGTGKKRVALVSLPGSGNTWIRGLLEKATGVCTGSIYCDKTLREGGFCGEGLRGTSLIAVKTHDSSLQWRGSKVTDSSRPQFDKAIFLIRNPFRANIAEWNRIMSKKYASNQTGSSHVKYVTSKAFFGTQGGWQALVKYQTHKWRIMIGNNLKVPPHRPVLVVFFEELKADPAPQLARMLEFLEVPTSPKMINATVMDGFTSYYRNHTDIFEHYTAEQKAFVNSIIIKTADVLQGLNVNKDIIRHIRDYALPSNTRI